MDSSLLRTFWLFTGNYVGFLNITVKQLKGIVSRDFRPFYIKKLHSWSPDKQANTVLLNSSFSQRQCQHSYRLHGQVSTYSTTTYSLGHHVMQLRPPPLRWYTGNYFTLEIVHKKLKKKVKKNVFWYYRKLRVPVVVYSADTVSA